MEKIINESQIMKEIQKFMPSFMKIARQMWFDYDKEADVLYISFEKPQNAEDSIMQDNIIIHKREDKIVGLTIVNASRFS